MATRVISVSPKLSSVEKIFQARESILWKHPKNRSEYEVGDIVYMYISGEKYIRFKVEVMETNVPASRGDLYNPTWKNEEDLRKQIDNNKNDRFKLIAELPEEKRPLLSIDKLRERGLNNFPYGYANITSNEPLIAYIESVFNGADV